MNRLQQLLIEGNPALLEQELRSLDDAIREVNGTIRLSTDGTMGAGSPKAASAPPKRPWVPAIAVLLLGAACFPGSFSPTRVTDPDGKLIRMLPFNPVFVLTGLLFLFFGYWLLCSVGELILEPESREWTLRRGIAPFIVTSKGRLDTATHWEMVVATRKGKNRDYGMWTLHLVGIPRPAPAFTDFKAFDLQPGSVDHDTAFMAYSRIAERTGIPLVDATLTAAVEAGNLDKIDSCLTGMVDTD